MHLTTRLRGYAAAAALTTAYVVVATALLPLTNALVTAATARDAQLGSLVGLTAALASWATLSWAALVTLVPLIAAAAAGTGSSLFRRVSALGPPSARHLVAVLLGAGLLGGTVGGAVPAAATQVPHSAPVAPSAPGAHARPGAKTHLASRGSVLPALDRPAPPADVATGWTPDRPAAPHRQSAGATQAGRIVTGTPTPGRHVLDHLVVRRGDTLWDIAARHLGPDASAAEIAREWPRWHHANRRVIGPDPGLLLPGQQLTAPAPR